MAIARIVLVSCCVLVTALCSGARAESFALVCDPADNPNFSPETFFIDEAARTVRHQSTLVRELAFTVSASISQEQIVWSYSNTRWTLDRYSGNLSKQIPEGVTNWRCRKVEKRI